MILTSVFPVMTSRVSGQRVRRGVACLSLACCLNLALPSFSQAPAPNGPGRAVNLDGVDDYVAVPENVWFSGDFTVESWVFVRSHNNYARLLDFGVGEHNNNVVVVLSSSTSGRPHFQILAGTDPGTAVTAPNPLPLNQWVHLACVLSGTTGTIYVNGVSVASGPLLRPINIVRPRCYLGRSNWASDAYASAMFDEVRIWNIARSGAQIQEAMRRQLTGDEIGLTACWRFDESTGMSALDASNSLLSYWPFDGNATALRGVNGTLAGTVTTTGDRNGIAGGALAFNGLAPSSVQVPGGGGLDAAAERTIAMWVKWTGPQDADCCGTFGAVLSRQSNNQFSDDIIALDSAGPATAHIVWRQAGGGGGPAPVLITGTTVVGSTWHHVAVTFRAGGNTTLYVDGVAQGSASGGRLNNSPAIPLSIGAWIADGAGYSRSSIDDVAIWGEALNGEQIARLAAQTSTPLEVDLIGNAANTATLVNGASWVPSTISPFAPTVTTVPLSNLTSTAATLVGSANPNNVTATGYFQWGSATGVNNVTPAMNLGGGGTPTNWSRTLNGLTAGQLAMSRAVATNIHGASYGATTHIVENTNDSGAGSLRQAVRNARSGDRVVFAPTVTGGIVLTNGEILITKNLTIVGPGAAALVINGNQNSRVFHSVNSRLTLSGLTISNGVASVGGGLLLEGGEAVITACGFGGNSAGSGGGVASSGNCRIESSTVWGNTSTDNFQGVGGGVLNDGTMTILNCTIAGNWAGSFMGGGGICNRSSLTLINSTVAGNFGGFNGGGLFNLGPAQIRNSIFAENWVESSGFGYGFDVMAGSFGSTPVSSAGFNLIGIVDDSSGWVASDRRGTRASPLNPFLGPLGDYGGPTRTLPLLISSPAIDAGDDGVLGAPLSVATDQRGLPRRSGAHVDIGAYEWEGYLLGREIPPPPGVILAPTNPPPAASISDAVFWHPVSRKLYATRAGFAYTITWRHTVNGNALETTVPARNSWPSNDLQYQIHVANSAPVDLTMAGNPPQFQLMDQEVGVEAAITPLTRRFTASGPGFSLIMCSPGNPLLTNIYFQFIRSVAWNDPAHLIDHQPASIGQAIQPLPGWHDTNFNGAFVFFAQSRYCALSNYYNRSTRTGPIIPVNRDRVETTNDDMVLIYYERGTRLFNPLDGQLISNSTGWPYKPVRYDCTWPTDASRLVIASQLGGDLSGLGNASLYVQNDPTQPGYNPNEEHALFFNKIGRDAQLRLDRTEIAVAEGGAATVTFSLEPPSGTTAGQGDVLVSVAGGRAGTDRLVASFSPTGIVAEKVFSAQEWSTPLPLYVTALTNPDANESVNETNVFILRASGGLFDQRRLLVREVDTNRLALVVDSLALSVPEESSRAVGIRLTQPPPGPVTVTLTREAGGDPDITFDVSTLSFTIFDWNVPQPVHVTANPDSDAGDDAATIQVQASGGLIQTNRLFVTTRDDDDPPQALYALRDDLGDRPGAIVPQYSEPYALVTYQNGLNPPGIRVFRVVAEEAPYSFMYLNNFAARLIQPPYPLSQLAGWEANTYALDGPWWQDRKKFFWARSAGDNGGTNHIRMKFFYPRFRPDFYFPTGTDPGGANIPWLDRRPGGTPGVPTTVTYEIRWPDDVPELRVGESLVRAKFGLPNIKGQTSVDIIYEQSAARGFGAQSSAKLIDAEYTYNATLLNLPPDTAGKTVTNQLGGGIVAPGSVFFTVLPPHLRSRLWWEPSPNSRLRFTGRFVPEFGTEEPVGYALLNVITARDLEAFNEISTDAAFRNVLRTDLAGPGKAGQVKVVGSNVVQTASAASSDTFALTAGLASREGYITVAFNNVVNSAQGLPAARGTPVSLQLIKVTCPLYRGETKTIYPDDPFSENVSLRHSGDFAGQADRYAFEWQYHQGPGKPAVNSPSWIAWTNGMGAVDMVAAGSGSRVLNDWWYRSRWRTTNTLNPCGTNFIVWTDPVLVEGWIKRALANINFFNQRYTNLVNSSVDTLVSVISQAGARWLGQVPLNADALRNSAEFGLIEIYETIFKRGIELTIEGTPPQGSANQPLLQVAAQLANIYMLLGNEAYADAADPTIGFVTTGGQYGVEATSVHCFMDQTGGLLDEELALLRGLDTSQGRDVRRHPIYNRLPPNMGSGLQAETAYALNYGIKDIAPPVGTLDASDAQRTFPQGHGDAWGHYLTAINNFYRLLGNPVFTWTTEVEFVKLAGGLGDVPVSYQHERKFAQVAAAKARTGAEVVNLTYRLQYVDNPDGQWKGYLDPDPQRAWGLSEWASRAGQGAYLDWVTANALLPPVSPGVGLAKVDRTTVAELREIAAGFVSIQGELDKADAGVNPLGLSKNVISFDIDPARADAGETHFEQIEQRAIESMNNAIGVFNHANASTQKLREQADEVSKFTETVFQRENDYTNRLVEVFGYPYPDDPTYAGNPNVPDLVHYMYSDYSQITGEQSGNPSTIIVPLVSMDIAPNGTLNVVTNFSTYHLAANGAGLTKPLSWSRPRRAPGEMQMAHSELVQSTARFKRALREYETLLNQVEDEAGLLQAQFGLNAAEVTILTEGDQQQKDLNQAIAQARQSQLNWQKDARMSVLVANAAAEVLPKSAGLSFDPTSFARAALMVIGNTRSEAFNQSANEQALVELDNQQAKEAASSLQNIRLLTLRAEQGIKVQLAQIEQHLRQEALLRLEIYTQQEAMQQAAGRYGATLARGQRLLEERLRFRQQTAGLIQGYRYKDMAFRIFRNEAVQQYRAQFDQAAMYVYLAAAAYDFETNLRDTETRWRPGSSLLTDIVRARSLGVIDGAGNPLPGPGPGRDGGLAAALYSMNFNWNDSQRPLRSQLGFNNPARENLTFSLRTALFRCLTNTPGDGSWRAWLLSSIVPDVGAVPEFVRYCKPPNQFGASGRAEPGLVIPFNSAILYGHNFFGWPETGGGGNFSASYFATKIKSTSVRFLGYDASHLTTTPHVYLVPVGNDVLLSPITQGFEVAPTREWKILDQFLPTPPNYENITATLSGNGGWIPIAQLGTADEPFLAIRRYAQMRAYHDGGINGTPTNPELEAYKRLIGRSAWNTRWLLIILGGDLLGANPDRGIQTFINGYLGDGEGVTDIELHYSTYSYPGN